MSGLSARTPLRVKLVAGVVLLAALGLLISSLAATTVLRGYLLDRVDTQLQGLAHRPGDNQPGPGDGGGGQGLSTIYFRGTDATGNGFERIPYRTHGPAIRGSLPSHPVTVPSRSKGEADWRLISATDDAGDTRVFGINLQDLSNTTRRLALIEGVVGLGVLVLLAAAGYLLVRRSLRPLVAVETTAQAIAAGDLTQRVPEGDPHTEVGSLSRSFNAMLAQIETAFAERSSSEAQARESEERMRRFVGDASHELRTPLTSIRGFAELYRSGALGTTDEVDRAMSRVESEASRMGVLVEDLLLLARLDQQRPLERASVDLLQLAGDAVQDAQAVDPSRTVELEAVASGPAPVVQGDAQRLRQVFGNLVANALTHTPAGTAVVVRVATTESEAVVEVADSGPGIPEEDRVRVFERFFRADTSRTRTSGGSGLGLSIVAALVAAHGGTVAVDDTPGGGATIRVRLPLAAG